MDQETQYFTALQIVDEFVLTGDQLTIYYDGGQGMLHFVKSADTPAPGATEAPEAEETPPSATSTPEPEAETQATRVEIPVNIGVYYDYAPATNRILYEPNETLDTVVAGAVIAQGQLVGWDMPGTSVWVQVETEMQSVSLPEL